MKLEQNKREYVVYVQIGPFWVGVIGESLMNVWLAHYFSVLFKVTGRLCTAGKDLSTISGESLTLKVWKRKPLTFQLFQK
jgi:hypothetical protein